MHGAGAGSGGKNPSQHLGLPQASRVCERAVVPKLACSSNLCPCLPRRAKPQMPLIDPDAQNAAQSEAQKLLIDPQRKLDSRPKGATNDHVNEMVGQFQNQARASRQISEACQACIDCSGKQELPKMNWVWQQPIRIGCQTCILLSRPVHSYRCSVLAEAETELLGHLVFTFSRVLQNKRRRA